MANLGPPKEDCGVVVVIVPHPQRVVGIRLGLPWDLAEFFVTWYHLAVVLIWW
jgi:hypothetical protein